MAHEIKPSASVLLVEDDPRLCASVVDYFRLHAVDAVSEDDIDAVRFLLRRHRFDAVLPT